MIKSEFIKKDVQMPDLENIIPKSERSELIGSIIDIFEDWLCEKGITVCDIANEEREGNPEEAIIFGEDYDEIAERIAAALGITRN